MNCPDDTHDDPRAPWNDTKDEGPAMIPCHVCGGSGASEEYEEDESSGQQQLAACYVCNGTGEVNAH